MTTKQTFWRTFAAIAVMLLTMPATLWADNTFGGGSGTLADPYRIENPQHLRQLAAEVNDGNSFEGVYFKLTQSFSCWIEPFTPIGGKYYYTSNNSTGTRKFCGDFNGNGKSINDLNIKPTEGFYGIGLFGELGSGAHIHDLSIGNFNTGSTIMGWGNCGAIAGSVYSDAIIYNCHVKEGVVVSVDPDNFSNNSEDFGGIAGENMGYINKCTSKATVTDAGCNGVSQLGGIVGYNYNSVDNCISLGTVVGTNQVGGIAGNGGSGQYYSGNYYHSDSPIGGVNGIDVEGAIWMGTISFEDGITTTVLTTPTYSDNGVDYFAAGRTCSLGNHISYNNGFIVMDPQLTSEQVTLNDDNSFTFPSGQDVVIGCSYSSLKRDIAYTPWVTIDIPEQKSTGEPLSPVITVTDIMTGEPVTLTEGDDYTVTLPNEDMVEVGEYPITITGIGEFAGTRTAVFVIFNSDWLGDGTEDAPYQIHSVDDMLILGEKSETQDFAGTHFILMNDLDFTGVDYKIVGINYDHKFRGNFDGNGKTIDNVHVESTNQKTGLFGWIGSGAVIKNLTSGAGNYLNDVLNVGGVVGRMESATITGCVSYATVVASQNSTVTGRYAGGIVGYALQGSVADCQNYGNVTAIGSCGGIVGRTQYTSITDNINFGQTTAEEINGGILGINTYGILRNNYYAGDCTTGGVDGSDVSGEAMRGYAVHGGDEVTVKLIDEATVGVAVDNVVYAGNEQQVTLYLSRTNVNSITMRAPSNDNFIASSGTLTKNDDGTWTLTMTNEDVTISFDDVVTGVDELNIDRPADSAWYTITGMRLPVRPTAPGIYINGGKKVIVR